MKSYYDLKSEIQSIQKQLVEARKYERTNALKKVKKLSKEFSFTSDEVKSEKEETEEQIVETWKNERANALKEIKYLCKEFGIIAEPMSDYEERQNFNFITRILHSTRFRNLQKLIIKIAKSNKDIKIIDIGCGPAKTYSLIKDLDINFTYVGIEPSEDLVRIAKSRYNKFENFKIICDSIENTYESFEGADLILGLESFEHIPEPLVVRIIENIAKSKFKYLYITVPNEIGPAVFIKNVGSFLMGWKRYKEYNWRETMASTFYNLDKVGRHGTRHKGFDWRWLAQTLRQNCKIEKITTSPFNIIPKSISPSIGFICKSDKFDTL